MQNHLFKYIWTYSRAQQLIVVAVTLLSFPIFYLTLELPKVIINNALTDVTADKSLFGWQLGPVTYLTLLCFSLLGLVIANGVIKMRLNTYKGIIGERLVRRMRYTLIQNILRFPLPYFSRISSGELISSVTSETEPLGGYIGESIAMPLFQGGTMITVLIFMFVQDWLLGLISIALIPVQGYLIPKLQQQVNALKKQRVRHVRKLSEAIGETVSGSTEIRLHGTQPYTLAGYSRRLGDLFQIRLEIYKKKYFMKFLNNTISQITPFMFYLFGGYLVIKGDLTIGALVAAIVAFKELTNPWRELLNYYQLHEDSKVKYQQILELFTPEKLVEVDEVETVDEAIPLKGSLSLDSVSWRDENGSALISGISLEVEAGATIAITCDSAKKRERLAHLLTGIDPPFDGSIRIDGQIMQQIPDSILRRRVALQGPDPHIFAGSISENLEYGLLQHEPNQAGDDVDHNAIIEAFNAGNRAPLDKGWLDYRQAGEAQRQRSAQWLQQVINATGASRVIAETRLQEVFNPAKKPALAEQLLEARQEINNRLSQMPESYYVAHFESDVFNRNASIQENILFGIPTNQKLQNSYCEMHPYLQHTIEKQELTARATLVGLQLARHLIDAYEDNALSHREMEHFGLYGEGVAARIKSAIDSHNAGMKMDEASRCLLLSLFLLLIPARHTFVKLSTRAIGRLLKARKDFREFLPADLTNAVNFFNVDTYHPNLSIKDNLLFGRISTDNPAARRRIDKIISQVITDLNLDEPLLLLFGESQVGIRGSRLPQIARHRIALGRSLLKRPSLLVFHDALPSMESAERQAIRQAVRKLLPDCTMIWIANDIANNRDFDQAYTLTEVGSLVARDSLNFWQHNTLQNTAIHAEPLELIRNSPLFSELSSANQRYIADNCRLVSLEKNTCIYEVGDNPDCAWMVVTGEVQTTRPDQVGAPVQGVFRKSDVFGLLEVMADSPRTMLATTTESTVLLRIGAMAIESVTLSDANISRILLRAVSKQWMPQQR